MKPIDKLLPRLAKVREVAPSQWVARCPAHSDQHPSLRVRELDDGTVLIKCWAGCSAQDICGAVGLAPRDLFVTDDNKRRQRAPSLKAQLHENLIVQIGTVLQRQGMELNAEDRARFEQAKRRLGID